MNVFQFIVAIVAIGVVGEIIKKWLSLREKREKRAANAPEIEARFDAMEERIQTLERIVTDHKSQLKSEIDALK